MGEVRADTISNKAGNGPATLTGQSAAKVYTNFDSAGTVAKSLNVSSITDTGTGDWTVNITNDMDSADYAIACDADTTIGTDSNCDVHGDNRTLSASALRLAGMNAASSAALDCDGIHSTIFGDLA